FFGTGGGMIGCALFGSECFGLEIDYRISRDRAFASAFHDYGVRAPDLLRADFSSSGRSFRPVKDFLDAIVADPPYGVRAGARKQGVGIVEPTPMKEEHKSIHIAKLYEYEGDEVIRDLLDAADAMLVPDGRLVYLFPTTQEVWAQQDRACLPTHP